MRLDDDDRRTRAAFDEVADDYARLLPDMTVEAAFDRAALSTFIDRVRAVERARVLDVGCGTGRLVGPMATAGLDVVGVDLSLGMLRVARRAWPDLRCLTAHAAALPLRAGVVDAVLAWYSIINLRPEALPAVFEELARVTRPGGPALVAFQSGAGDRVDRTSAYGHAVPLTYFRHSVDHVVSAAAAAGFTVDEVHRRGASREHETTPQAFILGRRRSG